MCIKNIIQKFKKVFSGSKSLEKTDGIIKFFDKKKRFGFIIANNHEYFFHAAATNQRDFKALQEGAAVKFNIVQGKKGPQADKVEIV